jgi:hypothetical protein
MVFESKHISLVSWRDMHLGAVMLNRSIGIGPFGRRLIIKS